LNAWNTYQNLGFPKRLRHLLLIELDGDPAAVENAAGKVEKICLEQGSFRVERAINTKDASNLLGGETRDFSFLAPSHLTKINEDVVVSPKQNSRTDSPHGRNKK